MSKRVALVSAVVVAALVAAVLGATAALGLIGLGAFSPGGRPLSETDVHRSLEAGARSTTPAPNPTPIPRTQSPSKGAPGSQDPGRTPAARIGAFSAAGGAVFASCTSGQATLTRWIPASGYSTDGYGAGPASSVWVKFKSGGSEQTVTVNCVAGNPHRVTSTDDHGGGTGGTGGGTGGAGGGTGGGGDDHGGGGDGGHGGDGGAPGGDSGGSGGGGSGGK
jgi:hypothetical protein